ncbi:hypothetical protein KIPB_001134, partial [Kipferlia bialata]
EVRGRRLGGKSVIVHVVRDYAENSDSETGDTFVPTHRIRIAGTVYTLSAAVVHLGVDNDGHYVTYRRVPQVSTSAENATEADARWCLCNDTKVTSVSMLPEIPLRYQLLLYCKE